jgi:hypothetical protein
LRENGAPYEPTYVTKTFRKLAIEAGLRRSHDLRHGAGSLMIGGGASLSVVSRVLRHSSIAITQSTYVHLLEGVGRAAAESAVAQVPRAPRDQGSDAVTSPEAPEQLRDLSVTTSAPNTEIGTASDAEKVPLTRVDVAADGAPRGNRTPNPLIKSQLLCQLS